MVTVRRATTFSFDLAIAEGLLVGAPLRIAVVKLAHRRMAPVDDSDPGARVDERRAADHDVPFGPLATLISFFQVHVPEVGARRVDQGAVRFAPSLRNPLQAFHLSDERWGILEARLADFVAQSDELGVVPSSVPCHRIDPSGEPFGHAGKQCLFFSRHGLRFGIRRSLRCISAWLGCLHGASLA